MHTSDLFDLFAIGLVFIGGMAIGFSMGRSNAPAPRVVESSCEPCIESSCESCEDGETAVILDDQHREYAAWAWGRGELETLLVDGKLVHQQRYDIICRPPLTREEIEEITR